MGGGLNHAYIVARSTVSPIAVFGDVDSRSTVITLDGRHGEDLEV